MRIPALQHESALTEGKTLCCCAQGPTRRYVTEGILPPRGKIFHKSKDCTSKQSETTQVSLACASVMINGLLAGQGSREGFWLVFWQQESLWLFCQDIMYFRTKMPRSYVGNNQRSFCPAHNL